MPVEEEKKAPPQQRPQPVAQPQQAAAQAQAAAAGGALPEGVTAMDVKDPDNINNLCCMSYLEKKTEEFKANMDIALKAGKRDLMKAW